MPKVDFQLPRGEAVPLIYGVQHPAADGIGSQYLNGTRLAKKGSAWAERMEKNLGDPYRNMLSTYAARLAEEVKKELPDFDAVISPPSSRPQDAAPFREAVLRLRNARDMTQNFDRKGDVKVGDNDVTLEQAKNEFIYEPYGTEAGIKSLAIVDESIGSGKTAQATLHHLRQADLPKDCNVTLIVWCKC